MTAAGADNERVDPKPRLIGPRKQGQRGEGAGVVEAWSVWGVGSVYVSSRVGDEARGHGAWGLPST